MTKIEDVAIDMPYVLQKPAHETLALGKRLVEQCQASERDPPFHRT